LGREGDWVKNGGCFTDRMHRDKVGEGCIRNGMHWDITVIIGIGIRYEDRWVHRFIALGQGALFTGSVSAL
jgi:hypothetical protein